MTIDEINEQIEQTADMTATEIELANLATDAIALTFAFCGDTSGIPGLCAINDGEFTNDAIAAARRDCSKYGLPQYAAAFARFYVVDGELFQD